MTRAFQTFVKKYLNRLLPDFFLNLMNYDLIWFFKLKEKGLITFFCQFASFFLFLWPSLLFSCCHEWYARVHPYLIITFLFLLFLSLFTLLICICLSSISILDQLVCLSVFVAILSLFLLLSFSIFEWFLSLCT